MSLVTVIAVIIEILLNIQRKSIAERAHSKAKSTKSNFNILNHSLFLGVIKRKRTAIRILTNEKKQETEQNNNESSSRD
jgi:hypothetical protein